MVLRRRSIRLRIFFLVMIPLLSLIGLYVFVASITVGDAVTEAQATTLKDDTGLPIGSYEGQLYLERGAALMYLAAPVPATLAQLDAREAATDKAAATMRAHDTSAATMRLASPQEKRAIANMVAEAEGLGALRSRVASRALSRQQALSAYNSVVAGCETVLKMVVAREKNAGLATQGIALVQMGESEDLLLQEDAVLESDMITGSFSPADRHDFAELVGARRGLATSAMANLNASDRSFYAKDVSPQLSAALTSTENRLIADPRTGGPPPVDPATWRNDVAAVSGGFALAGKQAANDLGSRANSVAREFYLRLILAGGLGLIAVIVSIFVSIWIGRGLVRQLADLRRSALTLATQRLPRVVARLRDGAEVDVSAEAPPIKPSPDEIGQVSQAFNTVQRTAIEATVDQARLRRGVSDVFRNLARRSQSLLHRQLTLLDTMERRAGDPDELADLYRLDHLTTRMRRHAEGLIILSGAAPGRSWRNPVRLVDVLRAAVAEIEDYTRVKVVTMTQAALAGAAVADVIHLIAELIENATLYSPPNTPVRLSGDIVGKGFAVEVEDRGLGLTEERLGEINDRLANPPEFDLSNSDQLGLFVAGQLAKRHGIRISLRPNPYGGTTAIILIPHELVVAEDVYERDAATAFVGDGVRPTGRHASRGELIGEAGSPAGAHPYPAGTWRAASTLPGTSGPAVTAPAGTEPSGTAPAGTEPAGGGFAGNGAGSPGAAGAVLPGEAAVSAGPPGNAALTGLGTPGTSRNGGDGDAGSFPRVTTPPANWFERRHREGPPSLSEPAQVDTGEATADLGELGLPRRIRQANLAPQLRQTGPHTVMASDGATDVSAPDPTSPDLPSPDEARATMTAIQRGWERGRLAFAEPEHQGMADRDDGMANETGTAGETGMPGRSEE